MNRLNVRDEIRRIIKDTDTDTTRQRWSDSVLNSRISSSESRIVASTKCLTKRPTDIDLVSGTSEYTLDTTYLAMIGVTYLDSSGVYQPLKPTTEQELDLYGASWRDVNGEPTNYYISRNVIGLYPNPNYSRTAGLRMEIYCLPTEMDDDADIPFNAKANLYSFHDIICLDVARRCFIDEGNTVSAPLLLQEYQQRIREMKAILNTEMDGQRFINIYETVRHTPRRTA